MKRFFTGLVFSLLLIGQAVAVDMPLVGINGEVANLQDYRGKWVVVNYWATWCPPCIEEMPELQEFHDDHSDRDAVVIGINIEQISKLQLQDFLDSFFITYPVYHASPARDSELGQVPGLPTTFLVAPDGNVAARQVGSVTREMLEKFIRDWQPAS